MAGDSPLSYAAIHTKNFLDKTQGPNFCPSDQIFGQKWLVQRWELSLREQYRLASTCSLVFPRACRPTCIARCTRRARKIKCREPGTYVEEDFSYFITQSRSWQPCWLYFDECCVCSSLVRGFFNSHRNISYSGTFSQEGKFSHLDLCFTFRAFYINFLAEISDLQDLS